MGDGIEYIKLIGEFGLLMLMFVAGLELDIDEFTGSKGDWLKPITTVFFQVLCSFATVMVIWLIPMHIYQSPVAILLGLTGLLAIIVVLRAAGRVTNLGQYSITKFFLYLLCPAIVLLGFAGVKFGYLTHNSLFNLQTMVLASCLVALNSTAVAIKLLENRDKKNTLVGTNVIGILIAQDLVLIIMIIGLRSLSEYVSISALLLKVSMALFILYIVKILAASKPSFISDALDYIFKNSKELTALFAVTLCFVCSAVADAAGLSDIYGAFIAGLVLGNVYKHDKYIIKICEPISNILMTMFFMWVGAMFDIQELSRYWLPIMLISIGIVLFKYFSNFYIIRLVHRTTTGLSRSCIILSSILLTQMSEFSIVMIGIVSRTLQATDLSAVASCDMMRSCTIVSLSLGAVLTVGIKNCLYKYRYIE